MRLKNLRKYLHAKNCGGIWITNKNNIYYLSGFNDPECLLFITKNKQYLLTDFRLLGQARRQAPDFEIVDITDDGKETVKRLLEKQRIQQLAFEADDVSVDRYNKWRKDYRGVKFVQTKDVVLNIRAVKSNRELKQLRRAGRIAVRTFKIIRTKVKIGQSEKEVASMIDDLMYKLGADDVAFPTIVASGLHSANPHHQPGSRKLRRGDFVILDFGAVVDGYHSDMTRTLVMGVASDKQRVIYETVLRAQTVCRSGVRTGMSAKSADQLARDVIAEAGYEQYFRHGTGHGVGLEIHEKPFLSWKSKDKLGLNNVITIEPGIYIDGFGGVRIEDDFIITAKGAVLITKAPKKFSEMIV